MELTINIDDKKKDGTLHVKVSLENDVSTAHLLENLQALIRADIVTTISRALTNALEKKQE